MAEGLQLIKPTELYNLLNQTTSKSACITIPDFLLLLDARQLHEYSESHVLSAKHIPRDEENGELFVPPYIDVDTKKHVVVYDNRTSSTRDQTSPAVLCANMLWDLGSKYPVKIVKGGYEDFSALYPFLRTQKMLYTPMELQRVKMYPIEVIPGFLYVGTTEQAHDDFIHKHLKMKAHVNVTNSGHTRFSVDETVIGKDGVATPAILNIPVDDDCECDILSHFQVATSYVSNLHKSDGRTVLIYSDMGVSRSVTIAIAHLMYSGKTTLKDAWCALLACHGNILPNTSFIEQLSSWEEKIHGEKVTYISNIYAWR